MFYDTAYLIKLFDYLYNIYRRLSRHADAKLFVGSEEGRSL